MTEENLSPWQQYKKNLGDSRPWDMLDPTVERASEEEANRRYSICKGCPELIKTTKQYFSSSVQGIWYNYAIN